MRLSELTTHTFKVADGLALTIDVSKPRNAAINEIVVIHFHGGFLVIGEKTTFPPYWLINACHARGWTYATASYRLMPGASGLEVLSDAVDAVKWVYQHISDRIIIAGSSAGGYLALATAAHPESPNPIAVLSVYGMLDATCKRYIEAGTPLRTPIPNLPATLIEIDVAARNGKVIDGYTFPANPSVGQRFKWIGALHEDARYPDQLTRIPALASQIATQGINAIPEQHRVLFPVSFELKSDFPPTVLLHGTDDVLVEYEQSTAVAGKMKSLGIDVHLELVEGQGHGFDTNDIDIEAKDREYDDNVVKDSLRRVTAFLDRAVANMVL
ncbi:hypothetical protein N7450_006977 [Penicillium hetheringtonii]|uniref:Alpha/beta hydrolase fold-3 domain-containing protein n=1 Tax=Penicillium hetheringtonii TaxID=911720 RepID=A0AAD6GRJ4_9EURO|nr:hypothetical protein N7450_006977 [Penicillium hetheringtonii]